MSTEQPLVSIGLAVYNGEQYLEEALNSLLGQTFTDFEIIISDNASTDHTAEICLRYAEQDARIRYHRNATNIGGANNENQTFRMSRGKYFRWAADDDICAPTLIEECVKVLEENPDIVLCFPKTIKIDGEGDEMGRAIVEEPNAEKSFSRFRAMAIAKDSCEQTYGLIRSDVLQKTRLQQNYTNSDRTLLAELAIHGKFHEIPQYLFYKRFHEKNVYLDWRTRMAWFDPSIKGKIVFPWWMQFFDYFKTIKRSPISRYEQMRCYLFMFEWALRFGKNLTKDLLVAFYMLAHSKEWRKQLYEVTINWS
ncbi:MAG: glycosyltransferase family 2 protein [Anaerolineaceae bacterium]|nr:glycosyltransferase family 2 protein [Anaerolineaceae bacterium]